MTTSGMAVGCTIIVRKNYAFDEEKSIDEKTSGQLLERSMLLMRDKTQILEEVLLLSNHFEQILAILVLRHGLSNALHLFC